jgi:transmembrane 9 superfamily protein 3
MMVLFLLGLVSVILLRAISRDYARYDKEELLDMDRDLGDEWGWKQVHGDVFRPPRHLSLIAAGVGSGVQLVSLALIVMVYTILGDLYLERATILTASIFLYAVTSLISGFFSGSYYAKYGGKAWVRAMIVTAGLWPGIVGGTVFAINLIAIYKGLSKAIPFFTMVALAAIWLFLVFPLTLVGAIVGRNMAGEPNFPCRVNPIPRPVPDKVWYAEPWVHILVAGLLPFGSIFIETYFVFTSFWEPNKTYYGMFSFPSPSLHSLWVYDSCVFDIVDCHCVCFYCVYLYVIEDNGKISC